MKGLKFFREQYLHKHTPYDSPTNSWSKTTRVARYASRHVSIELKALLNRSSHNFSESHLCKHTPYDLPTEMKSRKEINKHKTTNEKGILSKLGIPQLNTKYIHTPQYKGNANWRYILSSSKETLLQPSTKETSTQSYILSWSEATWVHPIESASAQNVRNEKFWNHRRARSASTSNQKDFKIQIPIEFRESLSEIDVVATPIRITNDWAVSKTLLSYQGPI